MYKCILFLSKMIHSFSLIDFMFQSWGLSWYVVQVHIYIYNNY